MGMFCMDVSTHTHAPMEEDVRMQTRMVVSVYVCVLVCVCVSVCTIGIRLFVYGAIVAYCSGWWTAGSFVDGRKGGSGIRVCGNDDDDLDGWMMILWVARCE